jgi:F420-dependent oxidoreductase-like protein
MRIGTMIGASLAPDLDGLVADVLRLEAQGFHSAWMANIFGLDAIGVLSIAGRETRTIELGTAVVPSYPRHPFAIAQQALTAQVASRGRFVLGIGLSHQVVIESMLGLSYQKPARHIREYLEVLAPLLRGEPVSFRGEEYRVNGALQFPGTPRVPVVVAALGPVLLRLAGRLADGTVTWMTGPRTLAAHTIPTIRKSASEAGRAEPRVIAALPVALVRDVPAAREAASRSFQIYGQLPSYRAMLDREGAAAPGDVAILGDERAVEQALGRLAEVGVTDFAAGLFDAEPGSSERTRELLASLAKETARG